ncbi:MAG: NAD-dependent epimerase/dehydratase family protein [Zoogloeaceae bacterium]|nr:NAD-dependent epimerase/dehydratase family protein [Zoogloeaceae bacterium]
MKILILGSNGFIGRNLAQYLANSRHQLLTPKRTELNLLDQEATEAYLRKHCPDVVINCAINIQSVGDNLVIYYNLERCASLFGRLINIGSGAEYAARYYTPLMSEEYFGNNVPSDTYGISKFCIAKDIECTAYDFVNLRVFGIFGEHEDHSRRFITNNICASIRNRTITVNRNSIFDYLDVQDFSRIVERFLSLPTAFKSYNVCTSIQRSLVDLAAIIDRESGRENILTIVNGDVHSIYTGDNRRLLETIGDFSFTPMETSVKRLFSWYESEFAAGRVT